MKLIIITLAMLTAPCRLCLSAETQEQKPQPPAQQQQKPQQHRMEIPADAAFYQDVSWSPDGRRIVYYAEKGDHQDQVWVMNSDGSDPKLLTGGVGHNIFPAFTRGGREIIFCSKRDGAEKSSVYTMKADGTELKKLAAAEGFYARPSPDGARVAFTTQGFPKNGIYVVGADGSGLKRLTP